MRDNRFSTETSTPFHRNPSIRKLAVTVGALAIVWTAFGDSSDPDEWGEMNAAEMLAYGMMPGYPNEMMEAMQAPQYFGGYETYRQPTYGMNSGYPTGGAGYGYGEQGAFRGEAQIGGVPFTSGTVDTSGGGNSVFSVGGKVIELP